MMGSTHRILVETNSFFPPCETRHWETSGRPGNLEAGTLAHVFRQKNAQQIRKSPFFVAKQSISMGHLYHGYVSHSQRVTLHVIFWRNHQVLHSRSMEPCDGPRGGKYLASSKRQGTQNPKKTYGLNPNVLYFIRKNHQKVWFINDKPWFSCEISGVFPCFSHGFFPLGNLLLLRPRVAGHRMLRGGGGWGFGDLAMYIYNIIYIYIYIIYIYISIYIYIYIYIYVYIYIWLYMYMYMYICICIYVCVCVVNVYVYKFNVWVSRVSTCVYIFFMLYTSIVLKY